jgi:3'-phosphoadenosine 5'-phosphosulfate sulfotransferase (PAPS reductase)/FAD synthetase
MSNWTELDVWQYIHLESIPIVPLYFARRAARWSSADGTLDHGRRRPHAAPAGRDAADAAACASARWAATR